MVTLLLNQLYPDIQWYLRLFKYDNVVTKRQLELISQRYKYGNIVTKMTIRNWSLRTYI